VAVALIDIVRSSCVRTVDGLANVRAVRDMHLYYCPRLASTAALEPEIVDELWVEGSDALQRIEGFARIEHFGNDLYLKTNNALTEISGAFRSVQTVGGDVQVLYNGALRRLSLPSLVIVGKCANAPRRPPVTIEHNGSLQVHDNAALREIDLGHLCSVNGDVLIRAPAATRVDLGALVVVGGTLTLDVPSSATITIGCDVHVGGARAGLAARLPSICIERGDSRLRRVNDACEYWLTSTRDCPGDTWPLKAVPTAPPTNEPSRRPRLPMETPRPTMRPTARPTSTSSGPSVQPSLSPDILVRNSGSCRSDLAEYSHVVAVALIDIVRSSCVRTVDGLANVRAVRDMHLYYCPRLASTAALEPEIVDELWVEGSDALQRIEGFARIEHFGNDLYLKTNNALTEISGAFRSVQTVGGDVQVLYNGALRRLSLPSLVIVGKCANAPRRPPVTIEHNGSLQVHDNAALREIDLGHLCSVNGDVLIRAPAATRVDLGALVVVGGTLTLDVPSSATITIGCDVHVGGARAGLAARLPSICIERGDSRLRRVNDACEYWLTSTRDCPGDTWPPPTLTLPTGSQPALQPQSVIPIVLAFCAACCCVCACVAVILAVRARGASGNDGSSDCQLDATTPSVDSDLCGAALARDSDDEYATPRGSLNSSGTGDAGDTCCVCLDAAATVLFLPCAHTCVCEQCHAPLTSCPLCRRTITRHMVEVF